jgi:hypothetical protein
VADVTGASARYNGFAEQCMAEYNLEGWIAPDMIKADEYGRSEESDDVMKMQNSNARQASATVFCMHSESCIRNRGSP